MALLLRFFFLFLIFHTLNREFGISSPEPDAIHKHADVRADDGHVPREAGDGAEEVAEQDEDAVELDQEPDQRPA